MLSDNSHYVYSGIAVTYQDKTISAFEKTAVSFKKMNENDINFYIESQEPFDKAGAYAIQGLASVWIEKIDGCYFNVVGLPLNRLSVLLKDSFGIDLVKYIKYSK
jgi:septum formation protein